MDTKNILFIAFKGNNSEQVLEVCEFENKLIIPSSEEGINYALHFVSTNKPEYVIGLGQYSGKDKGKLRIEMRCNKRFRNKEIKGSYLLEISEFLKSQKNSKIAFGLGNSWCNLLSVSMINARGYVPLYGFIHIPKAFDIVKASSEITQICGDIGS